METEINESGILEFTHPSASQGEIPVDLRVTFVTPEEDCLVIRCHRQIVEEKLGWFKSYFRFPGADGQNQTEVTIHVNASLVGVTQLWRDLYEVDQPINFLNCEEDTLRVGIFLCREGPWIEKLIRRCPLPLQECQLKTCLERMSRVPGISNDLVRRFCERYWKASQKFAWPLIEAVEATHDNAFLGHRIVWQREPKRLWVYGEESQMKTEEMHVLWPEQGVKFWCYTTRVGGQLGIWISCSPIQEHLTPNPRGRFLPMLGRVHNTGPLRFCRVRLKLFSEVLEPEDLSEREAKYFSAQGKSQRRYDNNRDKQLFPVSPQEEEDRKLIQFPFPITDTSAYICGATGRDRLGDLFMDKPFIKSPIAFRFDISII